jgi:hypothetical protein
LRYHWFPLALLEVSVTLPPWQNVVEPFGVIVAVGGMGFTVTGVATDEIVQAGPVTETL